MIIRCILAAALIAATSPALAGWQRSTFETRNEHKRFYPQQQDQPQQAPQAPADQPAAASAQPQQAAPEDKPAEKTEDKEKER